MMKSLRRQLVSLRNRVHHRGVVIGERSSLSPRAKTSGALGIGCDCTVLEARLGGPTKLGARVLVCNGAVIHASELGDDCRIEEGAHLAGCRLEEGVAVYRESRLCQTTVGRFSYIASETIVDEVEIGRFCSIGPRCLIGCGDHPADWIATSPVFYSDRQQAGRTLGSAKSEATSFVERRRIIIGHDVWMGAQVFVRDGVCIASGAIIAAGAVVTRDVPAYAVVGGVPARLIRMRFSPEIVEQMRAIAWWNWPEEVLTKARPILSSGNSAAFLDFVRAHSDQP